MKSQLTTDGSSCAFPTDDAELRKLLTPEQYRVMRENGTEQPFQNKYWNNHQPGIYVDAISGQALFSSQDKFDSGTGWPSFTKPIEEPVGNSDSPADLRESAVQEKVDSSHGMTRTEVRSTLSDSHLGHVFPDGPGPNGLRYCINSAALRFIPVKELEEQGYARFLPLFTK